MKRVSGEGKMRTMEEQMKKWKEKNGYKPRKKKKKRKRKTTQEQSSVTTLEKLSERDLHELMGTNRAIYERRRGSIRQK